MPVVTCPGCGRKIDLPMSELGLAIACAGCGAGFNPLGGGPLPATPGEEEDYQEGTYPPLRTHPPSVLDSLAESIDPSARLMRAGGIVLVFCGLALVVFFWGVYDTTVPTHRSSLWDDPYHLAPERVHNIGLMQDRLIGVLVGIASVAAGVALWIVGGRRPAPPA